MEIFISEFIKFVQESNAIEGYDYPIETYLEGSGNFHISNSFSILNYLSAKLELFHRPSTVQEWLILHSILMRDLIADNYRGVIRPIQVYIGNHTPPRPEELQEEVEKYFRILPTLTNLEAHFEFERIHPFVDGNGRIGRILWLWQEVLNGNRVRPILDLFPGKTFVDRRQAYYTALMKYHKIGR